MKPRPLAEFLNRQVGILDVPAHRQIGAVDLHGDPGRRNRLVLAAHRLRDREEVRFLARVVVVAEEQRDDARRGGAEECAGGVNPGEGRFQIIDVGERRAQLKRFGPPRRTTEEAVPRQLLSQIRLRKPPLRGSQQCNRNIAMITKKHFRQPLAIPIIHQGKTSTRRRSRTKTLLLDAMALGPAGSRRLIHCAIINNERGNANGYGTYRIGSIQGKGACHRCRMRPSQSWLW